MAKVVEEKKESKKTKLCRKSKENIRLYIGERCKSCNNWPCWEIKCKYRLPVYPGKKRDYFNVEL